MYKVEYGLRTDGRAWVGFKKKMKNSILKKLKKFKKNLKKNLKIFTKLWADGWTSGIGGLVVGGFLASSLYTSYEVKYFKMNKGGSSENSPRFISGFSIFTL